MVTIEPRLYGLKITLEGVLSPEDMASWLLELQQTIPLLRDGYSVLFDARDLHELSDDAVHAFARGLALLQQTGTIQADVVANDPRVIEQLGLLSDCAA